MIEEDLNAIWEEMEQLQSPTSLHRLLDASWPGRLEAVFVKPDGLPAIRLSLANSASIDADAVQQSEHVELQVSGDASGLNMLQVGLLNSEFRDVFLVLGADLCNRVLATSSEEQGARALVHHLARWLRMMKRGNFGKLSRERQIGLFGELTVLNDVLSPELGWGRAVASWTGPEKDLQDFQFDGIALEVKTLSASKPQALTINNERQLDDGGFGLLAIAHLAVNIQRDAGESLPNLVERIRLAIGDGTARESFDSLLAEVGYLDFHAHLYEDNGFSLRSQDFYRVGAGFPRIIESDLPAGVGKLRYSIDASACAPHSIELDRLQMLLRDPPPASRQIPHEESSLVEFKQTAWKSVDPGRHHIPDKVISEGIVKTVAGLLNSDGGELIIGVADRDAVVTGIEVDLDHLKTDRDGYENKLATLLRTHLGAVAVSNTRISFVAHEAGTTCHIAVRPSSKQVFGSSPVTRGSKFFWVRSANSTTKLENDEALRYIREHFG